MLREGPSPALEVLFGVSTTTARRVYITMLKASTFILTHHLGWPSLEAARRATPVSTRAELFLGQDTVVFLGDATEREMESPRQPDIHCLVYSEYKSTTTLKHNGVAVGNGFLCELTRGYPGSTSDNKIHEVNPIGLRLAGDRSLPVVYLYDKGFTQLFNVEKYGVLVMTPRAKEKFQLYFDDDAEQNKSVAKNRVNIEVIFGNCRTYAAFSRRIDLAAIDIADLEADAVRCEVNMWPPMHDWTLTGDVTSVEETREPLAQQRREERDAEAARLAEKECERREADERRLAEKEAERVRKEERRLERERNKEAREREKREKEKRRDERREMKEKEREEKEKRQREKEKKRKQQEEAPAKGTGASSRETKKAKKSPQNAGASASSGRQSDEPDGRGSTRLKRTGPVLPSAAKPKPKATRPDTDDDLQRLRDANRARRIRKALDFGASRGPPAVAARGKPRAQQHQHHRGKRGKKK